MHSYVYLKRKIFLAKLFRQPLQPGPVGADEGDHVGLGGLAVDADVLDHGAGLQYRLHLAEGDVFAWKTTTGCIKKIKNFKRFFRSAFQFSV